MPSLSNQFVQGGPVQPVYIMNKTSGDVDGGSSGVARGTKAAAGSNVIVVAPAAGFRIVVYAFVIQNESANPTTMDLQDGVSGWRCLAQNQGDGLTIAFDALQPWKLRPAAALALWLSAANSCGYSVQYAVEAV